MRTSYMFVATVVVIAGLAAEPTAAAECTTSGNTTICSVGEGGSGPTMPYPCEYDYYCDDNYWAVDLDMDPGRGHRSAGTSRRSTRRWPTGRWRTMNHPPTNSNARSLS